MSVTRNLHPWVLVGLGLLLFVVQPMVKKAMGIKDRVDPYEGTWGGHMTFFIDDPSFWEDMPGPHREAVLYFTLTRDWRAANGYYGPGEIYFLGAKAPRPIHINKFRPNNDGTVDLDFVMGDVLYLPQLDGNLKDKTITIQTGDRSNPTMKAVLTKGTETGFKQMMADAVAHSAGQAGQKGHP